MNKRLLKSLLFIFLLMLTLSSCSKKLEKRILMVHSYEENYVDYPDFNHLIDVEFRKNGIDAEYRIVYLNCETFQEEEEAGYLVHLLDSVSADGWRPDIILVNDDQAFTTLLKSRHPMTTGSPVVFGGVNFPNRSLLDQYPNVTGYRDRIEVMENLNLAARLFGDGVEVFTVLDSTYLNRQIREIVKEQVKDESLISLINYAGGGRERDTSDFLWTLSKYSKGKCFLQLKRDYTTVNIGNFCSSPCLTAINEAFGYNEKLLGGYLTPIQVIAEEEVSMAVRILRGESPADIPVADSRKEYMMDWNVMHQLGISMNDLPPGCTIINLPIWEEHPLLWRVELMVGIVLLTALFIWLWYLYRREQQRKRIVLYELEDEKETLSLAIEGGDTYAWKLESDHFIFENDFWKRLGMECRLVTFEELLGMMHPDHWDEVKVNWREISKAGKVVSQVRCDFDGKGYKWWEFRYKTVTTPGGRYKAAGLVLNVQTSKDHEQELEKARHLAEKAELKQSFLANMSHEIRTPLNAIVGFSNILAMDDELMAEDKAEYIDTINKNSDLLLKLINDILEISRIESGNMLFELEKCLVSEQVEMV